MCFDDAQEQLIWKYFFLSKWKRKDTLYYSKQCDALQTEYLTEQLGPKDPTLP